MTHTSIDLQASDFWKHSAKTVATILPIEESPDTSLEEFSNPPIIQLFDASNIDTLPWPDTPEANFSQKYLYPLVKEGTKAFIDNIHAEMRILQIDSLIMPLLIVNNCYKNSYVCSPYAHYVTLAFESLHLIKNRVARMLAKCGLSLFGKILKSGKINQILYVNHWLLSTDLYPKEINQKQVSALSDFLKARFPDHAIAFRSLNQKTNASLKNDLQNCGYEPIASRQIYLTNTQEQSLFHARIIKSDLKLWHEHNYEVIDGGHLSDNDYEQILKLYQTLSLDHHSHLNPQLNLRYIKHMIQQNFLKIKALRKDGCIEGVAGYFIRNQVLMSPFFGYDKDSSDKNRLYRLLSTMLFLEASKHATTFHQGAGASFYKTIRRAVAHQEYFSVNSSHLSLKQRLVWWTLKTTMNSVGAKFMKEY